MSFSILDPKESLASSLLLEASAGTGKTFAIEHLVLRLLIEGDAPPRLEDVLVVTFTKAATRELRERLRSALARSVDLVTRRVEHGSWSEEAPAYLADYADQTEKGLWTLRQRLLLARHSYHAAAIHTIHGFCYRSLRECARDGEWLTSGSGLEPLPRSRLLAIVRDFWRSELSESWFTAGQLRLLLKSYSGDLEKLQQALLPVLASPLVVRSPQPLVEQLEVLESVLEGIEVPVLAAELRRILPAYKGTTQRDGGLKPAMLAGLHVLEQDCFSSPMQHETFDALIEKVLVVLEAVDEGNLKARTKIDVTSAVVSRASVSLVPHLQRLAHPSSLFATLAARAQQLYRRMQKVEGWKTPDDLLLGMERALQDESFVLALQGRFRVAVIDEFQDTDPLQWRLFKQLFFDSDAHRLFLVGDPKQSIYAFRQADIYTYLEAKALMPRSATLSVNYRSQRDVVEVLNRLFSDEQCPGWIALPRSQSHLPYLPVEAAKPSLEEGAPVQFFVAQGQKGRAQLWPSEEVEMEQLFPFLLSEILSLKKCYADYAVLVRDRFQAQRLAQFFKQHGIPFQLRRTESLVQNPMCQALEELLRAVLQPSQRSDLHVALGGALFAWPVEALRELDQPERLESVLGAFYGWRRLLHSEGFARMFDAILHSGLRGELSTEAAIAQRPLGLLDLDALKQTAELLTIHEAETACTPEGLLHFFRLLEEWDQDHDPRCMMRQDLTRDAVQIMTMHISKGLEFDTVFCLGLASRTRVRERLIPVPSREGDTRLSPFIEGTAEAEAFLAELDAEKSRQFYVAATRAKSRLYLPIVLTQGGAPSEGEASPMELYLSHLVEDVNDVESVRARLESLSHQGDLAVNVLPEQAPPVLAQGVQTDEARVRDVPTFEPKLRTSFMSSFSAMAQPLPPEAIPTLPETWSGLPAGAEVGNLLHKALENILRMGAEKWLLRAPEKWCTQYFQDTLLAEHWMESYVLLQDALETPLCGLGRPLRDIPPNQISCEVEFLYPHQGGYLKGFVDVLIEHEGLIYVVDWKSNWLGGGPEDYGSEQIRHTMQLHQYDLQAAVYGRAVERWSQDPERFAGAIYVFLRGLPRGGQIFLTREELACKLK